MHPDLQAILSKHQSFFSTHQGILTRGVHDHSIPLVPSSLPPNVLPYHHPFSQKNEIEKIMQELLQAGVIRPSTNPYSSPVVFAIIVMKNIFRGTSVRNKKYLWPFLKMFLKRM
jgi:hypothetical protein